MASYTNLNKENLFNELEANFPKAMQEFKDWIDQYKKDVNWNLLFNSDSDWQDANGKNAPAPKFHDIPFEMQLGIFNKFFNDFLWIGSVPQDIVGMANTFRYLMSIREQNINTIES